MKHNPVTEEELAAKATGRRVTLEDVEGSIKSAKFFRGGDGVFMAELWDEQDWEALQCLTFCVLVLTNGYTVTGQSACADPNNYNKEIGERLAREDAVKKIWPLLGFVLKEDMARDLDLISRRAFTEGKGFDIYIGTEVVHAHPMSRAVYNDFRGWVMPANEQDDEGYLVEYTDGGQANVGGMAGYISWSPKDEFERSYREVGAAANVSASEQEPKAAEPTVASGTGNAIDKSTLDAFVVRMVNERDELAIRCAKLGTYMASDNFFLLPRVDQDELREQARHMNGYLMVLSSRIYRHIPN